jgi:biotin-dependent carboxylase-like uncharacterized protein
MRGTLAMLRPGIFTTVQDAGRIGYRALGVPGSGALDSTALRLVNAVVGNPANTAVLEMLYSGILMEARGTASRIAVGCTAARLERAGDGAPAALPPWRSTVLLPGDRLRVEGPTRTAAAYLAVQGGFDVPLVLGSASTYVPGRLGGYEGRALQAGDELPIARSVPLAREDQAYVEPPQLEPPAVLRVVRGPQADRFAAAALGTLLSAEYRVTRESNRTGLRLAGPALPHSMGHDLLSEGVASGSIQVPGSGQPVILVADHPTVGGYPKIATVISADIAAAGRLRIGHAVRFRLVDEAGAAAARRVQRDWIAEQIAGVRSAARDASA